MKCPRDPNNPDQNDDQVSLSVGCLFALPGIPCLYYGTEQGLSGAGNISWAVREALWGKPNAFDRSAAFYRAISQLTTLRNNLPALRYGQCYFRPISGDGIHFSISTTAPGVLAFSRILGEQEVVIVANTSTQAGWAGEVLIDFSFNPIGSTYTLSYSNKTRFTLPRPVEEKVSVEITEIEGAITHGPIRVLPVSLLPMEVQILAHDMVL